MNRKQRILILWWRMISRWNVSQPYTATLWRREQMKTSKSDPAAIILYVYGECKSFQVRDSKR
jgi:hypothetical protein